MSDKRNELPRDLRALIGGFEEDSEGDRYLLDPIMAYANVVAVRHDLERDIADPDTYNENRESLDKQLKIVKREQPELKKRILNHFTPSPPKLGSKGELSTPRVDHGAKSKVENRICRSPMKDRAAKAIEYPSIASLAG